MNEAMPLTAPIESPGAALKDRSTGLLVFGVLTVALGCLAGLFVLAMLAGQAMAARTTQVPANFAAILPAISIYASLAAALICLGIGSIQARRWARALLLIFSWSWLLLGIVTTVMLGCILPKEMYQLMGYPQAQIDQMRQTGLLTGNLMAWLMPISLLPIIGYLIFVKKYFRAKS